MNWRHLQAFLWLRWRMSVNQWRRGGALNAVLMIVIVVAALLLAGPLFVGCFALGLYAFPEAEPAHLMYVWDGLVAALTFFWGIGLVTELQRTEPLLLSKFLHLPVSVRGAFIINYVSSLFRLSLVIFVPVLFGLSLALVFAKGFLLLAALPLAAAFLLMITALTYQFQGWLASLMSNPRRRRTIVVASTALFVLVLQLPNVVSFIMPWGQQRAERATALVEELGALDRALQAGEIDVQEHQRRHQQIVERFEQAQQQATADSAAYWERMVRLANLVLPVGWLPWGVMAAAEGRFVPAMLACLGMTLIGAASLSRAYRTTIRIYQGQFAAASPRRAPAAVAHASVRKPKMGLLEAILPGLSEPVSAVALASFRSLVRASEAKMMLLTPLVLGAVFGSSLVRTAKNIPDEMRPLVAIGGIVIVLFGLMQLMANQFGFDRDGFRVFVLCAASRRDILLGKNLAFAPLAVSMTALVVGLVEVLCPLRFDHLLAIAPQFVSMFLPFCILTNLMSIFAPMHLASGTLKPANMNLVAALVQILVVMIFFPLTQAPTFVPWGLEALAVYLGWSRRVPIYLLLALAECAVIVVVYRWTLNWQGRLLEAGEKRILERVTNRTGG